MEALLKYNNFILLDIIPTQLFSRPCEQNCSLDPMNNAAMDVQFFSHYRMHPFTSENLDVTYGGRFGGIVLYFLSEHLSLSKFLILLLLCTHSLLHRNLVLMGMGQTQDGNRKRSTILWRLSWNPGMSCVVLQKNPACLIFRKLLYALQTMHHLPAVTGAERS